MTEACSVDSAQCPPPPPPHTCLPFMGGGLSVTTSTAGLFASNHSLICEPNGLMKRQSFRETDPLIT
ncbi:hypothetical protein RRG08_006137 [Elysia crispata]|uniref:Uncharacterized protein n=1 Tax=Elysia crispata TaxID=231223 RepID=A0AAE0Y1M8_9GAST|nr:hypothetical protein RRG08_006137 [Elysia crispata]